MKALSLWPTWGELVAAQVKWIETRSWSTSYRGPLAIANTKTITPADIATSALPAIHDALWPHLGFTVRPMPGTMRKRYRLGAVVATCELVDVIPMVGSLDQGHDALAVSEDGQHIWHRTPGLSFNLDSQIPYGDFVPGRFAWLLKDVKPTTERCPRCWGTGDHEQFDPITDEVIDADLRMPCTRCAGEGVCDPIPAKGRQQLWEWAA